jgi:hypothetical protein
VLIVPSKGITSAMEFYHTLSHFERGFDLGFTSSFERSATVEEQKNLSIMYFRCMNESQTSSVTQSPAALCGVQYISHVGASEL